MTKSRTLLLRLPRLNNIKIRLCIAECGCRGKFSPSNTNTNTNTNKEERMSKAKEPLPDWAKGQIERANWGIFSRIFGLNLSELADSEQMSTDNAPAPRQYRISIPAHLRRAWRAITGGARPTIVIPAGATRDSMADLWRIVRACEVLAARQAADAAAARLRAEQSDNLHRIKEMIWRAELARQE